MIGMLKGVGEYVGGNMQEALAILGLGIEKPVGVVVIEKQYDRSFVGFRSGTVHINGAFYHQRSFPGIQGF